MYLIKTPWWLKKIYPQLIWHKARSNKTIFLTFDDGPIPIVTPWVIKTLKSYHAKATFFCIGDNINKHPDIFLQLKADEHAIGNHTYNHLNGWKTANNAYINNVNKCQHLTQTHLFRPPYGRIKKSQIFDIQKLQSENLKDIGQNLNPVFNQTETLHTPFEISEIANQKAQIIMWDVLSGDFDTTLSPQKCLKNVLKHTQNGSIVVFHDSLKAWERLRYVLPKALNYWQKKGYSFEIIK
ncbi:MAG: polysaccharide deacetylase family protein [Sphingobacteriales bacterium]|nr:MAG: polysaccharide deacetylase family protein [Sphingobacteriales bacterium]TAF79652.1 MAG: polysaccharide deacetylase family protein [Sphingobacteriales bacterium]